MEDYQPQDNLPLSVARLLGDTAEIERHREVKVVLEVPPTLLGRVATALKERFRKPQPKIEAEPGKPTPKPAQAVANNRRKGKLFE